jgi:hypothetical protein
VSVYTVKILMKLVNFRRLKIGRRSRLLERKNEASIKDKIYLKQDLKLATIVAVDNDRTALLGDRETIWPCGATEADLGDRETVPGNQGAAVVPDSGVATHEIERPETHVKTECKK